MQDTTLSDAGSPSISPHVQSELGHLRAGWNGNDTNGWSLAQCEMATHCLAALYTPSPVPANWHSLAFDARVKHMARKDPKRWKPTLHCVAEALGVRDATTLHAAVLRYVRAQRRLRARIAAADPAWTSLPCQWRHTAQGAATAMGPDVAASGPTPCFPLRLTLPATAAITSHMEALSNIMEDCQATLAPLEAKAASAQDVDVQRTKRAVQSANWPWTPIQCDIILALVRMVVCAQGGFVQAGPAVRDMFHRIVSYSSGRLCMDALLPMQRMVGRELRLLYARMHGSVDAGLPGAPPEDTGVVMQRMFRRLVASIRATIAERDTKDEGKSTETAAAAASPSTNGTFASSVPRDRDSAVGGSRKRYRLTRRQRALMQLLYCLACELHPDDPDLRVAVIRAMNKNLVSLFPKGFVSFLSLTRLSRTLAATMDDEDGTAVDPIARCALPAAASPTPKGHLQPLLQDAKEIKRRSTWFQEHICVHFHDLDSRATRTLATSLTQSYARLVLYNLISRGYWTMDSIRSSLASHAANAAASLEDFLMRNKVDASPWRGICELVASVRLAWQRSGLAVDALATEPVTGDALPTTSPARVFLGAPTGAQHHWDEEGARAARSTLKPTGLSAPHDKHLVWSGTGVERNNATSRVLPCQVHLTVAMLKQLCPLYQPMCLRNTKRVKGRTYGELEPPFVSQLARMLRLGPSDHLIDIGCGVGNVVLQVALEAGCRGTGVEVREDLWPVARDMLTSYARLVSHRKWPCAPVELHCGDARNVLLDLATTTVILMNNIAFPTKLNQELLEIFVPNLKPGTRIVLTKEILPRYRPSSTRKCIMDSFEFPHEQLCSHPNAVSWMFKACDIHVYTVRGPHTVVDPLLEGDVRRVIKERKQWLLDGMYALQRLVPSNKRWPYTFSVAENEVLTEAVESFTSRGLPPDWDAIAARLPGIPRAEVELQWMSVLDPHLDPDEWSLPHDIVLWTALATYGFEDASSVCPLLPGKDVARIHERALFLGQSFSTGSNELYGVDDEVEEEEEEEEDAGLEMDVIMPSLGEDWCEVSLDEDDATLADPSWLQGRFGDRELSDIREKVVRVTPKKGPNNSKDKVVFDPFSVVRGQDPTWNRPRDVEGATRKSARMRDEEPDHLPVSTKETDATLRKRNWRDRFLPPSPPRLRRSKISPTPKREDDEVYDKSAPKREMKTVVGKLVTPSRGPMPGASPIGTSPGHRSPGSRLSGRPSPLASAQRAQSRFCCSGGAPPCSASKKRNRRVLELDEEGVVIIPGLPKRVITDASSDSGNDTEDANSRSQQRARKMHD